MPVLSIADRILPDGQVYLGELLPSHPVLVLAPALDGDCIAVHEVGRWVGLFRQTNGLDILTEF